MFKFKKCTIITQLSLQYINNNIIIDQFQIMRNNYTGQRFNGSKHFHTSYNSSSTQSNYSMNKTDSTKSMRRNDRQYIQRQDSMDNIRQLIRSEVFNTLLLIKNEIESKIKQIDSEIKKIRQEYVNLKQINHINIENIVQKIEKIDSTVKSLSIINQQKKHNYQNYSNQFSNDNKIPKKQRSLSKQKKPIFHKTENSLNLSSILFPQEGKKQIIQFLQSEIQNINNNNKMIPLIQEEHLNQIILKQQSKQPVIQHQINEQLIKNKNRFLKKKNKSQSTENKKCRTQSSERKEHIQQFKTFVPSKYNIQSIRQQENQESSLIYENFR